MKYQIFDGEREITNLEDTDIVRSEDGITVCGYYGIDKLRKWLESNSIAIKQIQPGLKNASKLVDKWAGVSDIHNDWYFDEDQIGEWLLVRKRTVSQVNGCKNEVVVDRLIRGVSIYPDKIICLTLGRDPEPLEIKLQYDIETDDQKEHFEEPHYADINHALNDSVDDEMFPACDPIATTTSFNDDTINVSIYNNFNQPVGVVTLENLRGELIVHVFSTSDLLDGCAASHIITPALDYTRNQELGTDDRSWQPVF